MGKGTVVLEKVMKGAESLLGKEGKEAAAKGIQKGLEKGLAEGVAKDLGKGVGVNAGKMASGWEKFKDVGKAARVAAGGTLRHSYQIAGLTTFGWGAYQVANGKGLISPVVEGVGGEMGKEYGLSGVAAQAVAGKHADKLIGSVTNTAGNVSEEVGSLYYMLKNGILQVGDEAVDLYRGGKGYVGGLFQGNGMVANGNGGYYDPTTQQYPDMNTLQGAQGSNNGLMGSLNQALGNVTGGSVSKMNLASLLLSAYMMFGRFGWMSKAAGLALGGMTLKNVNKNPSQQYNQQYNLQQQQAAMQAQATRRAQEEAAAEESMTVHRSR